MVKVSRLPVPRRRAHEARGHAERPQQVDVQQRDARARGVAEDQRAHRVVDQRRLLRFEDDRRGAREATEQRPRLLVDERRDVRQRARVAQAHDQRRELAPQQLPPVRARLVDGGKRQHRVLPHLARDACGPAKALASGEAQVDRRLDDAAIEERLHVGQVERRQVGPEELGRRRCRLLGGLARLARPRHRPGGARRRRGGSRRWREGGVGDEWQQQHFVGRVSGWRRCVVDVALPAVVGAADDARCGLSGGSPLQAGSGSVYPRVGSPDRRLRRS